MITHLRGRAYQAGAFLALIGGFLVVAPAPALADDPTVKINSLSRDNLKAGERTTVTFEVTNNGSGRQPVTITVASTIEELRCATTCTIPVPEGLPDGQPRSFNMDLIAEPVEAGRVRNGRIEVRATIGAESDSDQERVTVRGDERPPTANEVNGRVRDQDGNVVAGAQVAMQDSQGHQYSTTSSSSGRYKFVSSESKPISPGSITVGAQKKGYALATATGNAQAGQSATISLTMQATATPSPSASPSPTASATATPAEEVSEDTATEQPPAAAQQPTAGKAGDDDSGSLLFIILGGLLVAAGIGAIILVLMRRKDVEEGDDPDDAGAAVPAGGVVPPSRGRYGGVPDATRVAGAMSGHPADATMVAGPGLPRSMADAPTMLQQPVPADDEFADPYGAPNAIPHAGYAPAGPGGWGTAGAAGGAYGAAPHGAAPTPTNAYGTPAGPGAPYGGATGTFGAAAVPPPPPAQRDGGYGAPTGYAAPAGANPYARPPAPGYGGPGGDQRFDEPTGWYNQDADAGQAPQPGNPTGSFRPEPGPATGSFRPQGPAGHAQVPSQPEQHYGATYPPAPGRGPQEPPAAGGYQPGGGYPPAASGYGADRSGQPWSPSGDSGNAYGAPAGSYGRGTYGAPAGGGGHDEAAGPDPRSAYGRPDSYGQAPAQPDQHPQPGYGETPTYYGGDRPAPEGGGRHGGQPAHPPESTHPGQRRPLDWLDD